MKIGELAEATGVPQRMLRYYEQQGLLSPERGANGYRRYRPEDVDKVRRVRSLIRAGMPTRLVRVVLEMQDERWTAQCSRDFAETLAVELRSLEDKIACLTLSRDTLRSYLERTRHAALLEG